MIFQNCLKFIKRKAILKYYSWYLCQISLQIMLLPIQKLTFMYFKKRLWSLIKAHWPFHRSRNQCCTAFAWFHSRWSWQHKWRHWRFIYIIMLRSHTPSMFFSLVCFFLLGNLLALSSSWLQCGPQKRTFYFRYRKVLIFCFIATILKGLAFFEIVCGYQTFHYTENLS